MFVLGKPVARAFAAAALLLCAAASAPRATRADEAAQPASRDTTSTPGKPTVPTNDTWGTYDPGAGFLVARTSRGELAISVYGVLRYLNQRPNPQTWTDHLGGKHAVDAREDLYPHCVIIWLRYRSTP